LKKISVRAGLGIANQTWRPYGSELLKIKGEPIISPYFSFSHNSDLTGKFLFRSGITFKMKGTRDLKTRGAITSYARPVMAAHGTLLFYPHKHSAGGPFLSGGLGVDYGFREKPKVREAFPYAVEIYFDNTDYRRMSAFASFGAGFGFGRGINFEFEYNYYLSKSLKVRQLHINDTFFSIFLLVQGLTE